VPFKVEVDSKQVVRRELREQLAVCRALLGRLEQAAGWCARNDVNLDEAMAWVDAP